MTLVEVLVAMFLVLLVSAASLALVARARAAHRAGETQAVLQETLDAAFSILEDEIRMAGYLGLAPPGSLVAGASALGSAEAAELVVSGGCGPSLAHDLTRPIAGADGAYQVGDGVALQCRASPAGRVVSGADVLIVRRADTIATTPQTGRLQLETSLRQARLAADGVAQFGTSARWHDLEANVYYVSADSTGQPGRPSLRRKRLVGGRRPAFQDEELVSGIGDMQLEYGLDAGGDGDTGVDRWVAPGLLGAADVVRAVRLRLAALGELRESGLPAALRRQEAVRVIALRNAIGLP